MSTSSEYRSRVQHQPLFAEFTADELDALLELLDPLTVAAGETIVRQDDPGDCMYLLIDGEARVTHRRGGSAINLATLKPGDFFGELALVDEGPRSADVIAIGPATLLKVSQASIAALAGVYPTAAFKFLIAIGRLLVGRLRASNQRYIDSLLFPVEGKD